MSQQQVQTSFLSKRKLGNDVESFLKHMTQQVTGIETGITRLDKQLGGLPGFFSILGEPKACKSTFVLQVAAHNAMIGNPVFFIDQENGRARLARRLLCHLHGESWSDLRTRKELGELYQGLAKLPLYFNFGKIEMPDIEAAVEETHSANLS